MLISKNWNTKVESIIDTKPLLDSTAKAKLDIFHFPTGKKIIKTLRGNNRFFFDTYQAVCDEITRDSVFVDSKTLKSRPIKKGTIENVKISRLIKSIVDGD